MNQYSEYGRSNLQKNHQNVPMIHHAAPDQHSRKSLPLRFNSNEALAPERQPFVPMNDSFHNHPGHHEYGMPFNSFAGGIQKDGASSAI